MVRGLARDKMTREQENRKKKKMLERNLERNSEIRQRFVAEVESFLEKGEKNDKARNNRHRWDG